MINAFVRQDPQFLQQLLQTEDAYQSFLDQIPSSQILGTGCNNKQCCISTFLKGLGCSTPYVTTTKVSIGASRSQLWLFQDYCPQTPDVPVWLKQYLWLIDAAFGEGLPIRCSAARSLLKLQQVCQATRSFDALGWNYQAQLLDVCQALVNQIFCTPAGIVIPSTIVGTVGGLYDLQTQCFELQALDRDREYDFKGDTLSVRYALAASLAPLFQIYL